MPEPVNIRPYEDALAVDARPPGEIVEQRLLPGVEDDPLEQQVVDHRNDVDLAGAEGAVLHRGGGAPGSYE